MKKDKQETFQKMKENLSTRFKVRWFVLNSFKEIESKTNICVFDDGMIWDMVEQNDSQIQIFFFAGTLDESRIQILSSILG